MMGKTIFMGQCVLAYIYIDITYTHTHIYIYLYIYICVRVHYQRKLGGENSRVTDDFMLYDAGGVKEDFTSDDKKHPVRME